MAHVNRKEYWVIFAWLTVLTILEVVIALPTVKEAVGTTPVGVALVSMALAKAGLVGLFYMHLKHETKVLRLTVALPFLAPALYAFVLISEAAWRVATGQLNGVFP